MEVFRSKDQVLNLTETTQWLNRISKYLSESKSVCSGEKVFFPNEFHRHLLLVCPSSRRDGLFLFFG